MQGIIIKGIAGFYYVKVEDKIYECKARGKFRHNELSPMVGDRVYIDVKNGKGFIKEIEDRDNQLIRPVVANVTKAIVVFSLRNPDINIELLNRFLVLCEYNKLDIVICLNKVDLAEAEEIKAIEELLKGTDYKLLFIGAKEGFGIQQIRKELEGNITVLCGPSGVGKSTLLNSLVGRELMETGEISKKLNRGKHTTRHSELIQYEDGFIVDTPGFSSLEIDFIKKEELQEFFPDIMEHAFGCKFTGCLHYKEPGCSVKKAVEEKKINKKRYEFYIKMIEEIKNDRGNRR